MSNDTELKIPDLGDFNDVEVIELLVAVGDRVDAEDGILTLETDKAAMDVPAPTGGVIKELRVEVGDSVNQGDVYAVLTEGDSGAAETEVAAAGPDQDDQAFAKTEIRPEEMALPPASAEIMADDVEIVIPDLGDFSDVDVIDVLVEIGDEVAVEDDLISLETDKAAMDVPSSHAGIVKEIRVDAGDTVNEGDVIAVLRATGGEPVAAALPVEPARQNEAMKEAAPVALVENVTPAPEARSRDLPMIDEAGFSRAHASPSVRKLARELGVNLVDVKGSGRKGRVQHEDVKAWVKKLLSGNAAADASLPAVPVVDFANFGEIEEKPLTRIQKISGPRLQASWINLPHVTQHDLADITDLEARRQELKVAAREKGISLTPVAFIIRAIALALVEFPKLASSLSNNGKSLIYKKYCHIGFAADTPNGLVVPVIHDADRMDIYELATQLAQLSLAAREGKLKIVQMQGAVFTITSLGGIGGTAFTPIVNAPEVAILGVSRSSIQPVWDGEAFHPRRLLPLSLSYDHRVVDGAQAVRFTTRLGELLADAGRLVEALP